MMMPVSVCKRISFRASAGFPTAGRRVAFTTAGVNALRSLKSYLGKQRVALPRPNTLGWSSPALSSFGLNAPSPYLLLHMFLLISSSRTSQQLSYGVLIGENR